MAKMNRQVVAEVVAVVILACATFAALHSEALQPKATRTAGKSAPVQTVDAATPPEAPAIRQD